MDGVNPVKFEYDSQNNYIESIEDKDGDGVYLVLYVNNFFEAINIMKEKRKKDTRKIF